MTAPQLVRLPDGQTFTVSPVFAGVGFRSHGHGGHGHPYPVGWTVVLHTEDGHEVDDDGEEREQGAGGGGGGGDDGGGREERPFTQPTRGGDSLFISSVANPPASEFKPAASPTRQLAMLLWVTLYWYFHHDEPAVAPCRSAVARPVADWRVRVRPDGAFACRGLLAKLERMGLVACSDSAVVAAADNAAVFVSRPMFWQTPGRLFLFSPEPVAAAAAAAAPSSPLLPLAGPFASTSHLPTYYPPAALPYVVTAGVRHPMRPRPPRMGDVFYSRFVPSIGQYLSLRVASSAAQPVPHRGPVGPAPPDPARAARLAAMTDAALLESWHAIPRVADFWGPFDPEGLARALAAPHSFPVIGLWDGVPFGYFELYWVREDLLGRHVGSDVGDWDRGLHIMIGEEWARGRVAPWLTGLVHWCLTADLRTMSVCLEPRVDNQRILRHLDALGFVKEKQVALPHKQAWYVRLRRECWQGPAL